MEKKYTLEPSDKPGLFRIRALRNFGTIKAGISGGYVASERNLSHHGNCWISEYGIVEGAARVSGNARVSYYARVSENARVSGNAQITGCATVKGYATVRGNIAIESQATVEGHVTLKGRGLISGKALICGNETATLSGITIR